MTILSTIKNWFKTGKVPTQSQFWALFDSFWHKSEMIPPEKIDNLDLLLDDKADRATLQAHHSDPNAHKPLFDAVQASGKFVAATNSQDIYTEYRHIGLGTPEPNATLEVLGTVIISSDDASGASINTMFVEPFYIGSTDVNNRLQLLLNINGTAELPNSTVALIAARGAKSLITKEYLDSLPSTASPTQIISIPFYTSSSASNTNRWLLPARYTLWEFNTLYPFNVTLSQLINSQYQYGSVGRTVAFSDSYLKTINIQIAAVSGDVSAPFRLVVYANKFVDNTAWNVATNNGIVLYDNMITLPNAAINYSIYRHITVPYNSQLIISSGSMISIAIFKTTDLELKTALISLELKNI